MLGAVKRAVDDDSRPGRFLLTGSARSDGRHEVDVIAEAPDKSRGRHRDQGQCRAGSLRVPPSLWLRERLGPRFVAGIVLHTGPRPFVIDERIHALPIAALWGPIPAPV